ncbi:MAG: hypothetical protein QX191_02240 [Methylococcaceae bacterium]
MPREQAAAIAEAQKDAFSESLDNMIASRQDMTNLGKQIDKIESTLPLELADIRKEQAVQRWMLAVTVGGIVALIIKAFFQAM